MIHNLEGCEVSVRGALSEVIPLLDYLKAYPSSDAASSARQPLTCFLLPCNCPCSSDPLLAPGPGSCLSETTSGSLTASGPLSGRARIERAWATAFRCYWASAPVLHGKGQRPSSHLLWRTPDAHQRKCYERIWRFVVACSTGRKVTLSRQADLDLNYFGSVWAVFVQEWCSLQPLL